MRLAEEQTPLGDGMKRMRLDEGKVQAGEGSALAMLPVCVCGAGLSEASPLGPAVSAPTCPACGGSQLRTDAPEHRERRHLQDFLSAFV